MRIMFESYYNFFHYCMLFCRYVMLKKSILNEPKWGGTISCLGGTAPLDHRSDGTPGPTVATALATSTKYDTPVANFVNSR